MHMAVHPPIGHRRGAEALPQTCGHLERTLHGRHELDQPDVEGILAFAERVLPRAARGDPERSPRVGSRRQGIPDTRSVRPSDHPRALAIGLSPVMSTSAPPVTGDTTTHSSSGSRSQAEVRRSRLHHDTVTQQRFDLVDGEGAASLRTPRQLALRYRCQRRFRIDRERILDRERLRLGLCAMTLHIDAGELGAKQEDLTRVVHPQQ